MRRVAALLSIVILGAVAGCRGGDADIQVHDDDATEAIRFADVDVLPGGEVFAVGERPFDQRGAVVHHDGEGWRRLDPEGFINATAVWAGGPNDVWVGGDDETSEDQVLWRWNGTEWSGLDASVADDFSFEHVDDVWGTGLHDVWVIAAPRDSPVGHETIYHWDGAVWREHTSIWPSPLPEYNRRSIVGGCSVSEDDVWIIGTEVWDGMSWSSDAFHWNGSSWEMHDLCACIVTDVACGAGETWVTARDYDGDFGMFYRFDGAWTEVYNTQEETVEPGEPEFEDVWIRAANDAWVVGGHRGNALVWHVTASGMDRTELDGAGQLVAVDGDAEGRGWAFGDAGLVVELR